MLSAAVQTKLELDTRLEELETMEDEERIDELLGASLEDESTSELELGTMDELLGVSLEDESTSELELGTMDEELLATLEPS